jgi:hypothetical protein
MVGAGHREPQHAGAAGFVELQAPPAQGQKVRAACDEHDVASCLMQAPTDRAADGTRSDHHVTHGSGWHE